MSSGFCPAIGAQSLMPSISSCSALLAGGFGTGKVVFERPLEIAPVVGLNGQETAPIARSAHFQRRFPFSPPRSPPNGVVEVAPEGPSSTSSKALDLESGLTAPPLNQKTWSDAGSEQEPVVSTLHSRFHLDLSSAVAA